MFYICYLCNGLAPLKLACPDCNCPLQDQGKMEDYIGPYSPYMNTAFISDLETMEYTGECEHRIQCTQCGEAFIYQVDMSYIG
ncbi:hypothetical protein J2Z69_003140 [Paenibacillus shirakamiensis]|uniref:Uncharacterized protein n=1 Tax=Paenibacillus shirakamiensis TaxID=1265935 RepID=A0ABS4JK67_9BACL|nr:hypothetical protein [Paenibacillus shirakamiensis]